MAEALVPASCIMLHQWGPLPLVLTRLPHACLTHLEGFRRAPACLPACLQAIGNGELYEQHAELIKVRKALWEQDMVRIP